MAESKTLLSKYARKKMQLLKKMLIKSHIMHFSTIYAITGFLNVLSGDPMSLPALIFIFDLYRFQLKTRWGIAERLF